ncbi:MAG: tyrosine-type recombinase/integrase [Chromatiaceae bacterium]|jgi:site-specific recombinase XerD
MLIAAVEAYVAVRRSAGFQLQGVEHYLRDFAAFAMERGDEYIVARTAVDWAGAVSSEAQRQNRLGIVMRFAQFMRAEDVRHEIPPEGLFCGQRQRPRPYIFTDEEIQRLVMQARRLGPAGTLRPYTYSTLFGLLAVTGMRVAEARALRLDDITPDGLVIREGKFRKSRLIPLHESTERALEQYLDRRRRIAGNDPHLFVSRRGSGLSHTVVAETFHALIDSAGIPTLPGARRPRLMDLRHSFAVKVLLACPEERDRVGRHTLALTTYLGHAKVDSTYWYLETVPQLMDDIARRCEAFIDGGTAS